MGFSVIVNKFRQIMYKITKVLPSFIYFHFSAVIHISCTFWFIFNSYMEEENNDDSQKLDTDCIPKLGIEFGSEQETYDFYNECGRNSGFSIRKEWWNKRKKDGVVTSRKFTCCKEGNKAPW